MMLVIECEECGEEFTTLSLQSVKCPKCDSKKLLEVMTI